MQLVTMSYTCEDATFTACRTTRFFSRGPQFLRGLAQLCCKEIICSDVRFTFTSKAPRWFVIMPKVSNLIYENSNRTPSQASSLWRYIPAKIHCLNCLKLQRLNFTALFKILLTSFRFHIIGRRFFIYLFVFEVSVCI